MKRIYILFFTSVFSLIGCASWKDNLKSSGSYEVAVNNAIIDFLNTSKVNKEFKVFHIITISNENVIGVSINGDESNWQIGDVKVGDKREYFPSKFKEIDNKLFYWSDSTIVINNKIIDVMNKYQILDTIKYQDNFIPDGNGRNSEGSVDYYFCNNNYQKYKKINSKISIGYYKIPDLKCD